MKNTRLFFSLLLSVVMITSITAQNKKNCYLDYLDMFNKRHAKEVTDGVQKVIVTVRNTDGTECNSMVGEIEVKGGKIAGRLKLKTKDGEMVKPKDQLHERYEAKKEPIKADFTITDGMSAAFFTQKKFVVNLFFIDFLNPAPPEMVEAPAVRK